MTLVLIDYLNSIKTLQYIEIFWNVAKFPMEIQSLFSTSFYHDLFSFFFCISSFKLLRSIMVIRIASFRCIVVDFLEEAKKFDRSQSVSHARRVSPLDSEGGDFCRIGGINFPPIS